MSTWLLITALAAIASSATTAAVLILFLKRRIAQDKLEDELYLKHKKYMLQKAIESKLDDDTKTIELAASKIMMNDKRSSIIADSSNKNLAERITDQRRTLHRAKNAYTSSLSTLR